MSEYWVSKKKYFCKYCDIYIADDAPSRQQHENGLRHKGNTERFIRSIYKAGEKKKKDDEEERREMARVEQAAQIAFAQDVGAGRAKLSSGPAPSAPPPVRKPPPKPSNPYANYSTAKSLGYDDPDAERLATEAERRRMQGVAGDWEMVASPSSNTAPAASSSDAGVKRAAEALNEEESREFKLRKKTMGIGLGQIYDPGTISIKLKKREEPKEELVDSEPVPQTLAVPLPSSDDTDRPKWAKQSKLQWKKIGDLTEQVDTRTDDDVKPESGHSEILPKTEEEPTVPLDVLVADATTKFEVKPSSDPPAETSVVFKKRRAPMGTRSRRQGA
ncbi:hypothetical protein DFH07DRAFT_853741 [Mycena maculata]|uniref:Matrin-type domain-containing protein n=1 Tax=Mycena maculata TaxID=230809 RepID=A0AAD7MP32_9AGAR|nr:hypothetical protein DFH07DRAFT_853741 [Mycena maculata]